MEVDKKKGFFIVGRSEEGNMKSCEGYSCEHSPTKDCTGEHKNKLNLTNAERIRAMTDEELARFLAQTNAKLHQFDSFFIITSGAMEIGALKWLKGDQLALWKMSAEEVREMKNSFEKKEEIRKRNRAILRFVFTVLLSMAASLITVMIALK